MEVALHQRVRILAPISAESRIEYPKAAQAEEQRERHMRKPVASTEPVVQALSSGAKTLDESKSHRQVARSGAESLQHIEANTELLINDIEADEENKNSDVSFDLSVSRLHGPYPLVPDLGSVSLIIPKVQGKDADFFRS